MLCQQPKKSLISSSHGYKLLDKFPHFWISWVLFVWWIIKISGTLIKYFPALFCKLIYLKLWLFIVFKVRCCFIKSGSAASSYCYSIEISKVFFTDTSNIVTAFHLIQEKNSLYVEWELVILKVANRITVRSQIMQEITSEFILSRMRWG